MSKNPITLSISKLVNILALPRNRVFRPNADAKDAYSSSTYADLEVLEFSKRKLQIVEVFPKRQSIVSTDCGLQIAEVSTSLASARHRIGFDICDRYVLKDFDK